MKSLSSLQKNSHFYPSIRFTSTSNIMVTSLRIHWFLSSRNPKYPQISSVQLLSLVQLFVTPWTAAQLASLFNTNSRSSLKLMSSKSAMPSYPLILGHPLSSCHHSCPPSGSLPMSYSHQVAKVLEFQLQYPSFQ